VPLRSKAFGVAAVVAAAAFIVYAIWIGFSLGGPALTLAVDDFGEAVPALFAAGAAAVAARASHGRGRAAWVLIGASASAWGLGELAWAYLEVVKGHLEPFPSVADIGFLASYPLAVTGLLAFPTAPSRSGERVRTVLDGLIAGSAGLVVSWALVLRQVVAESDAGSFATALSLGYPLADVAIITIALLVFSRTPSASRAAVLLVAAGFGALAFSDSALAYLTSLGSFGAGSLIDAGWVAGFLLVGLAALAPAPQAVAAEAAPSRLRITLPYLPVAVAALVAVVEWRVAAGDPVFLGLVGGMVGLAFTSLLLSSIDHVDLLRESRAAHAEAEDSRRRLEQVVATAPVGIVAVDADGRLIVCEGLALAQIGIDTRELVGRPAIGLVDSRPELIQAVTKAMSGERAEVALSLRGRSWEIILQPRIVDGAPSGFTGVVLDVTSREEAAAVRREIQAKTRFLSLMSHELRTPLNAILGFSQLLMLPGAERLTERQSRYIEHISKSGEHLLALINDFLDLSKVAAGEMPVDIGRVELRPVLEEAIAELSPMAAEKGHDVRLEDGASVWVVCDRRRLFQVALNLLSNAIKFTPDGGRIRLRVRRVAGSVEVVVEDNGIGIAAEDQARIFNEFTQLDAGANRANQGTGLGLALSRRLLELMNGTVRVESTAGVGSTFTVSLPAARKPRRHLPPGSFAVVEGEGSAA
jgi:PAS domain S-box-containing protein